MKHIMEAFILVGFATFVSFIIGYDLGKNNGNIQRVFCEKDVK